MAAILSFPTRKSVFGPTHIKAMAIALEDVCRALNFPEHAVVDKEAIATRIVELATGGERSPTKLRDRVLSEQPPAKRLILHGGGSVD